MRCEVNEDTQDTQDEGYHSNSPTKPIAEPSNVDQTEWLQSIRSSAMHIMGYIIDSIDDPQATIPNTEIIEKAKTLILNLKEYQVVKEKNILSSDEEDELPEYAKACLRYPTSLQSLLSEEDYTSLTELIKEHEPTLEALSKELPNTTLHGPRTPSCTYFKVLP